MYLNNKFLSQYYFDVEQLKAKRFKWDRNSKTAIFMIYTTHMIHKGMYWRRGMITPMMFNQTLGTLTLTRKPLAHPIKREKKGKKKLG